MNEQNAPSEGVKQPVMQAVDLTPRPGQSDVDIKAWMDAERPSTKSNMLARKYAGAIYKTKPSREDDPAGEAAWREALTNLQKEVLAAAKRQKAADPKVQAAAKRRRAADTDYQQQLVRQRVEYRGRIEVDEGREVRGYRRGAKLTADEKKAERKARNDELRARIREELMAGRNPFTPEARPNSMRHHANYAVCRWLLQHGDLDPANGKFVHDFSEHMDVPLDEARKLIAGAVELLRTAKAISKKGDLIYLRCAP